ncbi:MAG: LysE family translocator, partial [Mycobacterium sp.]
VLPLFTDPAAGWVPVQMALLGAIFVLFAVVSDSLWAVLASSARNWFARSPKRLEAVGATGGLMIVGLGAGVAVSSS